MAKGKYSGGRKWKPGQSGNPNGRPKISKEYRQFKNMTAEKYKEIIENYFFVNKPALEKYLTDNVAQLSILELWLANAIVKGINDGDARTLETLMARVVGRPKQDITVDGGLSILQAPDIKKIKKWREEDKNK
ncbi:MAG: DUF5681 domain-containing protein [Elusimicrobiota bacterium]|jgi:hypothetical protein|nr:DUF5681 domain-containing protein [Elusimicrobiota bacterium]